MAIRAGSALQSPEWHANACGKFGIRSAISWGCRKYASAGAESVELISLIGRVNRIAVCTRCR